MAIDLKSLDKKKTIVIAASLLAGIIAVGLTNQYIESNVTKKTNELTGLFQKKEVGKIYERIKRLEDENSGLKNNLMAIGKQVQSGAQSAAAAPKSGKTDLTPSLSALTPEGTRAITITINKLMAAGGLILPGDYVDIVAHMDVPTDPYDPKVKELISVTLFQNAQILAVEGVTSREALKNKPLAGSSGSITVVFALNPYEANLLTFAQKHGKIQLLVRGALDKDAYKLPATTWKTLSDYIMETQGLDIKVAEKSETKKDGKEVPKKKEPSIEVFQGGRFKGMQ